MAQLQRAEFVVHQGIKVDSLHKLVDALVAYWGKAHGCMTCGLGGIEDVRLRVVNPEIMDRIGKLPDVAAVSFEESGAAR